MALGWLVLAAFWTLCTVLCVNGALNSQTAVSQIMPVFPEIPDEFWEKVGVKKAKGKTGRKRKGRAKA